MIPSPLLDAWCSSGSLNQMLGMLADKSYRGHVVSNDSLARIKALVHEAENLTAQCLKRERVGEEAGEG